MSRLLPEVAPKVGHDIVVHAFLHHEDFLLYDGKVVPWKQREKTREHMENKLDLDFSVQVIVQIQNHMRTSGN